MNTRHILIAASMLCVFAGSLPLVAAEPAAEKGKAAVDKVASDATDMAKDNATKAVNDKAGDLVGIFPEGRITDTGELYPFRKGITRIVERTPVPVVPMALKGLWGSFFSRKDGAAMTLPFRRGLFSKVSLSVTAPVAPASATPEALQEIVAGLRGGDR